jgi:hypothetical protein
MAFNTYHVMPSLAGGWSVRKSGALRADRTFETKHDAIGHGRVVAKKVGGELVIHGRYGNVCERTSYSRGLRLLRATRR